MERAQGVWSGRSGWWEAPLPPFLLLLNREGGRRVELGRLGKWQAHGAGVRWVGGGGIGGMLLAAALAGRVPALAGRVPLTMSRTVLTIFSPSSPECCSTFVVICCQLELASLTGMKVSTMGVPASGSSP